MITLPSVSTTQTRDAGKIFKVALLPFLINSQENLDYLREGIYDILSSRITVEGRITVVDRTVVERALIEEKPMRIDDGVATKIGTRVGADYVVHGSLTKIGNFISLDARLISITEEKPPLSAFTQHKGIDDVMVKIGDFGQDIGYKILGYRAMSGRQTEPKHPYIVQQRKDTGRIDSEGLGFKKSQTFGFEIKGLDIGDVDGDKKNEVVVMDDHNLYIFKYDGEKLTLFKRIEHGYEHNFLSLDVVDVNRNGFAEIIVTSVVGDDLRSFILEYEEGKFRKITEKSGWFFQVLDHPKDGPILMGQNMGSEGTMVGPIYKFVWDKKSFEKGPKMPFPKKTNIFGLALADIRGKGKTDLILLDETDRLNILSEDGKTVWNGRDRFGATKNFYDTRKKNDADWGTKDRMSARVYISGRILIRDLDRDGLPEVIVSKNERSSALEFERIRSFEKGEIHDLMWDGDYLATNWKTKEIRGYVSDYQIKDVDNDGEEELVVAAVAPEQSVTGFLSKTSRSNILFFKLF